MARQPGHKGEPRAKRRRALVEALEPRLLLSADLPGAALGTVLPNSSEPVDAVEIPRTDFAGGARDAQQNARLQENARREIVFIDAGVEDAETLVADLSAGFGGERSFEVHFLDAGRDGVEQIGELLAGQQGFDAVHIVSHGTDQGIQLGDTWLTRDNLVEHGDAIAGWRSALDGDADVLLYGCNLAGSSEGKALVANLASLTGADVAASVDATGAAVLGGDWDLEYATGAVESSVAFGSHAQAAYAAALDGTAIWTDGGTTVPDTSNFDGVAFTLPGGPTADVMNEWKVIVGAEAPTRDEKIVLGVGEFGRLSGMMWDGSSWTAAEPFGIGFVPQSDNEKWGVDVAYESQSGDAVITYHAEGFGAFYSVWDGSTFTVPLSIAAPASVSGNPVQIKLAADPNSDEMVLVVSNENNQTYAHVWDGDAWDAGTHFPIGDASAGVTDINVVYEQQSGRAMVVFGDGTWAAQYRIWDGSGWSGGSITQPGTVGGQITQTALAADPNSDRIAFGAITEQRYGWLSVWDGTSWESSTTATTNSPHFDRQAIAVAFESNTGEAIAVYATGNDKIRYRTWDATGGWSNAQFGPDLGSHPDSLTLDSDPYSDTVMLSVVDMQRDVTFAAWDGDGWVVEEQLENDAGTNKGQPFLFLWDQQPPVGNVAPVLVPGTPTLNPITEDDIANSGQAVSDLIVGAIFDPDGGSLEGIAITSLTSGNGTWEFSTDGGGAWNAVGPVSQTSALLLRDSDRVRFVPDGRNGTTADFDFRAWDQTSGGFGTRVDVSNNGGSTAFSSDIDTANIVVSDVNDAPVVDASGDLFLTNVIEDDTDPPGNTVASILVSAGGNPISDVDTGALEGIAVTNVDDSNGIWQYSTDGGAIWLAFGAVSTNSAVLLDDSARIRFVPGASYTGPAGDITFQAWDRTLGANGDLGVNVSAPVATGPYSTGSETATLTVIAVNDAPVLTPFGPTLNPIDEDQTSNGGQNVASIVGGSITDADAGAFEGIAVTGLVSGNGTWEYSIDGGGAWIAMGAVSDGAARLLRDSDLVRFVPDAANADTASLTYRAWDQTSGAAGSFGDTIANGGTTAFSTAKDTASIVVGALNDAPLLDDTGDLTLTDVVEDDPDPAGDTVAAILLSDGGNRITDVDNLAVEGIAVTGVDDSDGKWQYSIDGGGAWTNFDTVSDAGAVLLDAAALVRFVPATSYVGTAGNLEFRAWDQSLGTNGQTGVNVSVNGTTTPYSVDTDTATLTVTPQNDAPVLVPAAPSLPPITEDDTTNTGTDVASIVAGSITDADAGALEGIAITSTANGNGTWEYSIDGGAMWTQVGMVTNASALLLRESDLVRFVPDGQNGTAASFDFRAWDQTVGVAGALADTGTGGGTSAFSLLTDSAAIAVGSVNDAPVLDTTGDLTLTDVVEDDANPSGDTVAAILLSDGGNRITDVDNLAVEGIAVTGVDDSNGTWQYSTGGAWTDFGPVSDAGAVLLDAAALVRFVPAASYVGTAGNLQFRAWDQSLGASGQTGVNVSVNGTTTPYSADFDTATLTVTPQNDAPVLVPAAPSLPPITEDETTNTGTDVASIVGTSVTDVDAGAFEGIAITSTANGNGTWEYSIDGGGAWIAMGAVSDGAARLLRDGDLVRFVPDAANADTASLTYRAWDQTSGAAGSLGDTIANGGTTPFSTAKDTASIAVGSVNDAPVLDTTGDLTLTDVVEDDANPSGDTVAAILLSDGGNRITDVDNLAVEGIAVTGVDDSNGTWQYSTGGAWTDFGPVSDAGAVLLDAAALVRFVPAASYVGTAGNLQFRAWDQSLGASGQTGVNVSVNGTTTPYSADFDTATLTVTPQNDAPVLTPVAPGLTPITEDDSGNAGDTVASIVGTSITDADPGALEGIAITALSSGNGTWQARVGAGPWTDVGGVSASNALLLASGDSIRFVPDGRNADSGSFSYRAWDQSSGVSGSKVDASNFGGTEAFSSASDTASIAVSAVNDAPSLGDAALGPVLGGTANPAGERVDDLFASQLSDVDNGSGLAGVAVVANAADPDAEGTWEYSSDNGANWSAIGTVGDDATALVLGSGAMLRFVPAAGFDGTPTALQVRGLDDSYVGGVSSTVGGTETRANVDTSANGGTSAISGGTAALSTDVVPVPDEPILEPPDDPVEPPPEEEPPPEDPPETDPPAAEAEPEVPLPEVPSRDETGGAAGTSPPIAPLEPELDAETRVGLESAEPAAELDRREDRVDTPRAAVQGALDNLRNLLAGGTGTSLTDLIFVNQRGDFMSELDQMTEEIDAVAYLEERLVGSSIAVSSGLSVGYVIWLTRGGLLLASLLSSMPAWRLIDPVPILAYLGRDDDEAGGDDESLDSLVGGGGSSASDLDGDAEADAEDEADQESPS